MSKTKTINIIWGLSLLPLITFAQSWQWANSGGSVGFDRVEPDCIVVDKAGNTYIMGSFFNTLTIGTIQLTSHGNNKDVFWAKFDKNGNVLWAKSTGGKGEDHAGGIAVDSNENVYAFLSFNDTIVDGGFQLYNSGFRNDLLLAKYDKDGNLITYKSWGSPYSEVANNIAIDINGYIYIWGILYDFWPTPSFFKYRI